VLLDDKVVIITGAGSGVGRAAAELFAREGAHVFAADLRDDWAKETHRRVEAAGGTCAVVHCDVTSESDVEAAVRRAVDVHGRLDVMVNNAGIASPGIGMQLEDHDDADWERLMNVNLRGVFYGCKHSIKQFKLQGHGVIVNTGSAAGMVGWGGVPYGVSKAGVIQMTRGLAIEVASLGIRVNCICPGAIDTNFATPPELAFKAKPPEARDLLGALHPLGRPIEAEDCARAALYLASDLSSNVTGVALPVDGGYLAR
jgi:NAD(P)-dependent dehydrogenase (short-subunit alcohol dehydrogenase family)